MVGNFTKKRYGRIRVHIHIMSADWKEQLKLPVLWLDPTCHALWQLLLPLDEDVAYFNSSFFSF